MTKNKIINDYAKLSKNEKGKLTLLWLTELIKEQKLTIQDVMDILNCVDNSFSNIDKFKSMLVNNYVSASTISRLFGYGYAKSMKIINLLLDEKAIKRQEHYYTIVDKNKFNSIGENLFKDESGNKNKID